ncbi:unnamed protein product [Orchesella dallaii]|uniref:FLYWCH-type domain-containing protein n=1 Tax=Orchesella dallaii TaxID=48710 RepID=A0ABP1RH66_9HEXA
MDDSEFVEYPRTFGKKVCYKLCHGGYTYDRRTMSSDKSKRYYYCDQRKICNASIIWKDGTWTYGKGTWEKNGEHTHHEPDNERCAAEIARGTAKLMAKTDPYVTASQIMEKVVSNGLPQPYPNDNAIKQSLLRVRKSAARVTGNETLPPTINPSEREAAPSDDHDHHDEVHDDCDDDDEVVILDSDDSSEDSKPNLKRQFEAETSFPTSSRSAKIIKTDKPSNVKEQVLLFDSWGSDSNRLLVYTNLGNLKCTVQSTEGGITKVLISHVSEAEGMGK